ncbi:MAG TPA: type IV secretory system conjugative DNA transfer family protein, partial [Acidimicrobiales bacterium]|nr:type IV secretory system conjugative DNA transfer family protein [Acidimicrobiales bacterium]
MSLASVTSTVVGLAGLAAAGLLGRQRPAGSRPRTPGWPGGAPRPRARRRDHDSARWARPGDLRSLTERGRGTTGSKPGHPPAPAGRLVLGWSGKRLLAAEPRQSVIVFGPTQSRKTSGFAVPAILEWGGPVIATSVKADLVGDTIAHRRRCGEVACFDPSGSTGLPSTGWSPLPAARTWPGARRVASSMIDVGKTSAGTMGDGDFWYATAAKMLAPLLFAAASGGLQMTDVIRWVDTQEESEVLELLYGAGVPEAVAAALSLFGKEERQRSSIYTTAETILEPFGDEADGGVGGEGQDIEASRLVSGPNTLYLCAPAHDQRRLSPLFTAVLRQVLEHVYDS